jgi:hypothetical protein
MRYNSIYSIFFEMYPYSSAGTEVQEYANRCTPYSVQNVFRLRPRTSRLKLTELVPGSDEGLRIAAGVK